MNLLLDTHIFVWWITNDPVLLPRERDLISDGANVVFVSAATTYEIVRKHQKGKWPGVEPIAADVGVQISRAEFVELPITSQHMQRAAALPDRHADPWDRIISAQALEEDLVLVTRDEAIRASFPVVLAF